MLFARGPYQLCQLLKKSFHFSCHYLPLVTKSHPKLLLSWQHTRPPVAQRKKLCSDNTKWAWHFCFCAPGNDESMFHRKFRMWQKSFRNVRNNFPWKVKHLTNPHQQTPIASVPWSPGCFSAPTPGAQLASWQHLGSMRHAKVNMGL